ncbi:hypothetical protein HMPREF9565_02319 [Cutibacterium acnes HL053PA2]|nr:hypothetical protein HMPREF9593_00846 [Cutibacterium acnes HL046PA2]EFT49438.1 hypothetical protein HMPREF9565_02319 [Cutibacterium acnes HL053PA2]EFT52100.1 hypothetical protein HMPREF9569_02337 [Cutibacterium acnes HL078PA1]EGE94111.1 hypothetical protein HMPREF9568_00753 [Cutibacterium acnes HL013PA2]
MQHDQQPHLRRKKAAPAAAGTARAITERGAMLIAQLSSFT